MSDTEFRMETMKKVSRVFYELQGDSSKARGQLATLRRAGLGRLEDTPDVWEIVYRNDLFEDRSEKQEEQLSQALLSGLHLYAVHIRKNKTANKTASEGGLNVGQALAALKKSRVNIDTKAAAVFGAVTPHQTIRLLAPLLRMTPDVSIDYPKLVWEFYLLHTPHKKQVQQSWAKSYFRNTVNPKEN